MTVIGDNLTKLEVRFQTISELMAKKRKLYLHKRVKSMDDNSNENTTTTNPTSNTSKEDVNRTSQPITSLNTKTNSNSLTKCSFIHLCFTSSAETTSPELTDERYNYEYNPELRICMECKRHNELKNVSISTTTTTEEIYNKNCSCKNNCHCSCRPTIYHHNNVLKYKPAQESLASHNNNKYNCNTHNQEIHMQDSYYLLRTQMDKLRTSCASTTTTSSSTSTPTAATIMSTTAEFQTSSTTHRTYLSTSSDVTSNKNFVNRRFSTSKGCKRRFILHLYNIVMILKTLLVLITRTAPSLLHRSSTTSDDSRLHLKNPKYYRRRQAYHQYSQLNIQLKKRLTHSNDQSPQQHNYNHYYYHKQKSSSLHSTPNVSFTKLILMGLSFLSILLPLSQALSSDFETTLQSSIAALDRSRRDVVASNDLQLKSSSPNEQVRLTRPEHVCKSLDIRNSASQFRQVENCTVIEGFLLITLLNGNSLEDYNETFPLLTEVTDYIIVYQVHYLRSIGRIFPNLSVIRGRVLFEGYALIVYSNSHLEELGLTNLTTISRGGVRIEKNVMLCFVNSIDWTQIVSNTTDIVIEDNRDTIECPACPGDQWNVGDSNAGTKELACKEHHGRRHCWNSKSCQKICPKRCQHNCVDENTCCNEACLGGCSPNNLNECISCRNFSIYNTTCIDKCPDNFYKYLDRRCLTAESCSIIGTKYENNRQEILVAYEGSCSTVCPEGYTKVNMTCVECGDKCTKKCQGSLIDSAARAREFHGCTHIVQSPLMINIKRGGRHLMEDLAYGLSSIVTIETALKVQGTYGVFDLKFFKNLQNIEGENLIEDKYALYVLENTDIETIWNHNQTVQILRGTVYFHFNPKLCLSEINALLPMVKQAKKNVTSFDKIEVSEDSNGVKGSCNTTLLNITISKIGSLLALVKINNPMVYGDPRTFIGYQFLHIEDPFGNATKHAFRPCEDKWEISDPTKDNFYIFQSLKPYTRYSFYVKTLTISTERRNGQSAIHNFTTKSDQPKSVNKLQAYANSSYNIVMSWLPPTVANGKLIKYKIRAVYDKRIQRIESRNYCKDPLKEISKPEIPVVTITEKPTIPKNCNCKKINSQMYDDEEIDASIHASIELENALQNFVYVKKENKTRSSRRNMNSLEALEANSSRNRRAIEGDPFDSFLLRHIRDAPAEGNAIHDTTTPTTTTTTTMDPQGDGTLLYNETRMDPEGTYFEVVVDSVNASMTEFVFSNLKHFSWYMLGVEACREKDTPNDTLPDCSIEVKTHVRTLKLENVDRVEHVRGEVETTNSSRSNIRVFWVSPKHPNGAVVSYTILYLLQSPDAVEEKKCITESDYIELGYHQNGYPIPNLNPGNYTIRINTNTLAGEGQFSDTIWVVIPPVTMPTSVIIGIVVGALSAVTLIGVLIYCLCRKRILAPSSDLKIFPSVNPHYISLQYIPDEWEVARDKVIQLNPLGQGSFGMVYEGILKGYNNSSEDTPCAIKTVNENATDRERMNFLNEACVMKQFDTFHVVRLLGVCSRGQPALVVMELMKNGDLKSYLRAHRPDDRNDMPLLGRSEMPAQPPPISRIYQMAIEIADGMAYLAAKKFVHRDLAARNCMVAADLTVKIGDFGMTRDIYENDYYRKGTKGLLPVRWMPPESLRDGVYSTASDVFSYGVVLWEMATLAAQPYQGLSNDQVLRYVIDGGVMERPENCPDKLYSLMQKCWHHRPSARPTFLEIIRYLLDSADPYFREVSFYHSEEGQQILVKEITERNQRSGDVFDDHDNDMEDVTTPLRLEEYSGYKLNMDNNSSVEHRGDSSMVIDDDAPHSPYSLTGSPIVVSSTPDEHVRNNFNMSRIINSHNQILNSAPSTSAELRKAGPGISYYPHPHTHPHHRNLYQPTRYAQQQARQQRPDDVDAYVPPDFEMKDLMEIKRDSDEQGYEMYDPSPNYSEKVPTNVHGDDDDDDLGVHSTAGQNLLAHSKPRQRQPTIMPLSSSMPDEVIGQPTSSSLHPSTASAASSNASSKTGTGRYPSLRAVADSLGNNVTAKFRSILFNTHKRSGSNASYKSTSSNPNTAAVGGGTGGSSNNLTRGGRGKSMSGQNLGTIESGGSGSAGSYCANPRFYTTNNTSSTSENPNYKRLESGSGDTLTNKPKMSSSSAFSMSSNPNYQVLDESLNTTGASTSTNNPAAMSSSSLLHTSDNPNYQLMQAPGAPQKTENLSSYVMMNEPKAPEPSAISISNNPNYQMMGPPPPPSALSGTMSTTVLPTSQPPLALSRAGAGTERFTKYSSSSSAQSTSSSHETDEEDDDIPTSKGMKSDRIPLSRRSSNDRNQKKKHLNNRSRSQSSSSSSRSSNTTTTTSQQQPSKPKTSLIATTTLLTKENWLKQQPAQQQHHQQTQPPPPPNGFVGRETT
ncbi:insulin-like receptor [Lucilia cuprina]|nr:insulin-like receptor [Lucilia cuprina]XP_046805149.1 insulin-like receptor [Lucilia cuprina]XP_046805150.1 insulin-like receptor [Lucilia cuprina]XP_046805151.1 insulin-like receptor [Lucilia cuprina]